jgi:hypothetical protein
MTASEHGSSPIGQEADVGKWQPIETALDRLKWEYYGGSEERFYEEALVYGPTWAGGWGDSPSDGNFTGECKIAIASTYSGCGYWRIPSAGPGDYDEYIQPTHWMPLPDPPTTSTAGR